MKWFVTEIKALHPITGEMKIWGGPNVQGISAEQAQQWCNENLENIKKKLAVKTKSELIEKVVQFIWPEILL